MSALSIKIFKVAERSMHPAIEEGSYILVNCADKKVRSGDVVVLKSPENHLVLVKRVKTVKGGKIFVEGDNKKESRDSRKFGYVELKQVIGKVIFVF